MENVRDLFVFETGGEAGSNGATTVAEDRTGESATGSEADTELGVATPLEAEAQATVGGNNTGPEKAGLMELGTAVATLGIGDIAADGVMDVAIVSAELAITGVGAATRADGVVLDGSNMKVTLAPTDKAVPLIRALALVTINVPAETVVPPV
jgi:hypothetical protein